MRREIGNSLEKPSGVAVRRSASETLKSTAAIARLNSLVLPESLGLARAPRVPPAYRREDYAEQYDSHTLIYDAIVRKAEERIVLICPKLLNLEPILRAARFRSQQGEHRIKRIIRRRRYDEVWLAGPPAPEALAVTIKDWRTDLPLSREETCFDGLNAMVAVTKNNRLEWLRDWARYHVAIHGLEGVLLFDNGSTAYAINDIQNALSGIDELKAVRVVAAPFPYGPLGKKRSKSMSKYFQTGMLNIARQRFLSRAAAVLQLDVDELVTPENGQSVFTAARNARFGFTAFRGHWVYAKPAALASDAAPRHSDHVLRAAKPETCPYKYCIVPNGPLRSFGWEVHGVAGKIGNRLAASNGFGYWHCWHINTNWKGHRREGVEKELVPVREAEPLYARAFSRDGELQKPAKPA